MSTTLFIINVIFIISSSILSCWLYHWQHKHHVKTVKALETEIIDKTLKAKDKIVALEDCYEERITRIHTDHNKDTAELRQTAERYQSMYESKRKEINFLYDTMLPIADIELKDMAL